jgi:pilus assembly protein CpaF
VPGPDSAEDIVEREVRELVRRRRLDPGDGDTTAVLHLIEEVVADYDERSLTASLPRLDRTATVKAVADRLIGLGPLQPYFDDPEVEEIWINEPGKVFIAKAGRPLLTTTVLTEQQVHDLVERMLRASGRRVDLSSPFVDATLTDGSRLHVVIPDITRRHWAVNIRRFVLRAHSLEELVRLGTITSQCARFLEAAVVAGLNIVVAGATQAGKTTLLNCLAAAVPPRERVVTCEEAQARRTRSKPSVRLSHPPRHLPGQAAQLLRPAATGSAAKVSHLHLHRQRLTAHVDPGSMVKSRGVVDEDERHQCRTRQPFQNLFVVIQPVA